MTKRRTGVSAGVHTQSPVEPGCIATSIFAGPGRLTGLRVSARAFTPVRLLLVRPSARRTLAGSLAVVAGLLALCLLIPGRAEAAAPATGALPLPDLLVYGTVTNSDGELLAGGTVKVMVRNRTIAAAPISAISGTDYTYLLVIPMAMLGPQPDASAVAAAMPGEVISFFVDDQPAFFQDPETHLTVSALRIPENGPGQGLVINLNKPGAMRFLMGDVNANGVRNSADALLALKYDVGMISGGATFPPGPNTAYLPLCDIAENGRCDSSDALFILQCDVGMSGILCPDNPVTARMSTHQAATADAPITLSVTATAEPDADAVGVQVLLGDPTGQFGAATLDLLYDASLLAVTGCAENPMGALDLVTCNTTFAPGVVRFSGVAAAGGADGAPLLAVQFKRLGATPAHLTPRFTLRAASVYDQAGDDLAWQDGSGGTETPGTGAFTLYLPTVAGAAGSAHGAADGTTALPAFSYQLHLPLVNAEGAGAAESNTAPVAEDQSTGVITETGSLTGTEVLTAPVTVEPGSEPAPAPTPPEPLGGSLPPPPATPVADLPKADPLGAETADRQWYLPLVSEE